MVRATLSRTAPLSKPEMQLLVFAATPPPVHGQSLMVQTLVTGLPAAAPDLAVHHVNPRLSRDAADIGRWRIGKLFTLIAACVRALRLRARHGPMVFYYVPAPGKRSALYRDWLVLLLCRPFFQTLVLHWHAVGLGTWLSTHATTPERWLTHRLLGRADLALVLAPELAADAQVLSPRRTAIVPNGIPDPLAQVGRVIPNAPKPATSFSEVGRDRWARRSTSSATQNPKLKTQNSSAPTEILFLGLCSREKGLFDLLAALAIALRGEPGGFRLTVAGPFTHPADEHAFRCQTETLGSDVVRHVGFADDTRKPALFAAADVFCFPTGYAHEGAPLVLLEALAHDVPIITTRWRAIPGLLPAEGTWLVAPGCPDQIADALLAVRRTPPSPGSRRAHFLAHHTRERHLAILAAALASVPPAGKNPFA